MVEHLEFDTLRAIYDNRTSERRFLMERQFAAMIQAVTLNLIVTGASFTIEVWLPASITWAVITLLVVFNVMAAIYLYAKKRSYKGVRKDIGWIEDEYKRFYPRLKFMLTKQRETSIERLLKFLGDGTNIFFAIILISACCSIPAVYYTQSHELSSRSTGPGPSELDKADKELKSH